MQQRQQQQVVQQVATPDAGAAQPAAGILRFYMKQKMLSLGGSFDVFEVVGGVKTARYKVKGTFKMIGLNLQMVDLRTNQARRTLHCSHCCCGTNLM